MQVVIIGLFQYVYLAEPKYIKKSIASRLFHTIAAFCTPLESACSVTLLQRKSPSSIWIVVLTVRQGTLPLFYVHRTKHIIQYKNALFHYDIYLCKLWG